MNRLIFALLTLLIMPCPTPQAQALAQNDLKRVALVVGNANYRNVHDQLKNPGNDARAMAAGLRALGIEVIEAIDLDYQGMREALRRFDRALQGADAGLFYYAGHGMEYHGRNYLFPTDAVLETEGDVGLGLIDMGQVLELMETSVPTRLVFLDACRDNPLARRFRSGLGSSRSGGMGQGLGRMDGAVGTFIAYSTAPGEVANDGIGANSPFTEAMINHMREPGLEISQLMHKVRNSVIEATGEQQVPWESSSLRGPFVLNGQATGNPAAPAVASLPSTEESQRADILFWESVKDSAQLASFEAYLARFGDGGLFAPIARDRITALREEQPWTVEASLHLDPFDIQDALRALGFDVGQPDGSFGPGTRSALRAWQQGHGLSGDGYLTADQVERLLTEARGRPDGLIPPGQERGNEKDTTEHPANVAMTETMPSDPLAIRWALEQDLASVQGARSILDNYLARADFSVIEAKADQGDALASTLAGFAYYYGQYAPQHDEKAWRFLDGACRQGIAHACHVAAYLLEEGRSGIQDFDMAHGLLQRACKEDFAQSCTSLGDYYAQGRSVDQDYQLARDFLLLGCQGGHIKGCVDLGWMYDEGVGSERDHTRARVLYEKACNEGHSGGCNRLGRIHHYGLGVDADGTLAKPLYEKACASGNLYGCTNLGNLYRQGLGVAQDFSLAWAYYNEACNQDHYGACTQLGYLYRRGLGVERDFAKAQGLYEKACNNGDMSGCTQWGWMHEAGLGVNKDYRQAASLYEQGCNKQYAQACEDLAYLYENGLGVAEDAGRAQTFLKRACDLEGDVPCSKLRN